MKIQLIGHECVEVSINKADFDHSKAEKVLNRKIVEDFSYDPVAIVNLLYGLRTTINSKSALIDSYKVDMSYKVLKLYKDNIEKFWAIQCPLCGVKAESAILEICKYDHKLRFVNLSVQNPVFFNIDHIVEKCHGGSSHSDNLRVTCDKCNTKRSVVPSTQYDPLDVVLKKLFTDLGIRKYSNRKAIRKRYTERALQFIEQNKIQPIVAGQKLIINNIEYEVVALNNGLVCAPKSGGSFKPSEIQKYLLNHFCS